MSRSRLDRRAFLAMASTLPALAAGCNSSSSIATFTPTAAPTAIPNAPSLAPGVFVADLRFGQAPVPTGPPGYTPAADAAALFVAGTPSPATSAVPGTLANGSYGTNQRYVIKVPQAWNGKLAVIGTPAFRSEYASDFIWGDFLLSLGYAWASSNKAIPYNTVVEAASASTAPNNAFPICYDIGKLETNQLTYKLGVLNSGSGNGTVPISAWNTDFITLTLAAKQFLAKYFGGFPSRTYAVGISNGGAQVRSLLEARPDLVDGGVDWEGVYWSANTNLFSYIPQFLANMPAYVASGFTDPVSFAAIRAAGFAPDITNPGSATRPSLWLDYYSNIASFYMDLTLQQYALLIDPVATSSFGVPDATPNAANPAWLPGTVNGTGLAVPANRGTYSLSSAGRANIASFAHTGAVGKPLITVAGTHDVLVASAPNATAYLNAVKNAGAGGNYWQYLVQGGNHLDPFAPFYPGMQPILPFAWAAFRQMVAIVETGYKAPGAGTQQTVVNPAQISSS